MKPLVECVANFSEGRDLKVLDAIVTAILSAEAVQVLDLQMDVDHHRSVVTFMISASKQANRLFSRWATSPAKGCPPRC